MPPLMKESEFGMKTTRRTLIVILLALLFLFPQAVIVPETLASDRNLKAEANYRIQLTLHGFITALHTGWNVKTADMW